MEERITLKGLSKILNLSISTISKSLNNGDEISAKTKERVKNLAALNNYFPNPYAQNLVTKRGKTIGVIVPTLQLHFFALALESMICQANEMDYKIIVCISEESVEREISNINFLIQSQVDGIIMSPTKETQELLKLDHLKKVNELKIPLVFYDRLIEGIDCDTISIEYFKEARQATQDLF